MTLPIHERFYSWQGEGVHMGRPAFFIRTFGCPLHCPWCDSAGTWHPDYVPQKIERMEAVALVAEVTKTTARFVVLTGGEPTVHDLTELTLLLQLQNIPVHLETAGSFHVKGHIDWMTLSPKHSKLPLAENVVKASEFKLIIETPGDIAYWTGVLLELGLKAQPIWLHPEWSQRDNHEVKDAITEAVKSSSYNYRAGWQLHKLYRADALDKRSAAIVPLGGDITKGF